MKLMATVVLVSALSVALTAPARADDNRGLSIFLDADPAPGVGAVVNEICPQPNEIVDVYVCFDSFGSFGAGGGILGASFLFDRTFLGIKMAQTNLLPGPDFGDVETTGWTVTAGADCQYADCAGELVVAKVTYLYLGGPGRINILPHPVEGATATDCENLLDAWCTASWLSHHGTAGHFGVCMAPLEGDCDWMTWTTITEVTCEPQNDGNPAHPPAYWYDVALPWPMPGTVMGFSVQVFDPDFGNYTNWHQPYDYSQPESVAQIGREYWITWRKNGSTESERTNRFGFDNPSEALWGHWTLTESWEPYVNVLDSSWEHDCVGDGYGYRVHVPVATTSVDGLSWGRIKALYGRDN